MALDFSVVFDGLEREKNGNVKGNVSLEISGSALGQDFNIPLDSRNFSFAREGSQEVYNQTISAGVFSVNVTASVYEAPPGQCCIRGHVHIDAPIGGGVGQDLDPNCQAIS